MICKSKDPVMFQLKIVDAYIQASEPSEILPKLRMWKYRSDKKKLKSLSDAIEIRIQDFTKVVR